MSMKNPVQLINRIRSINRSVWRSGFLLIPLATALVCVLPSPPMQAACQQGCFAVDNTVLGEDAFLTAGGTENTAIGVRALSNTFDGGANTGVGWSALENDTTG